MDFWCSTCTASWDQDCVRSVLAPVASMPGHVVARFRFQGLDGSIYHCQSVPIRGVLHSVHHGVRQRPLQAIEFHPLIREHNVIGRLSGSRRSTQKNRVGGLQTTESDGLLDGVLRPLEQTNLPHLPQASRSCGRGLGRASRAGCTRWLWASCSGNPVRHLVPVELLHVVSGLQAPGARVSMAHHRGLR